MAEDTYDLLTGLEMGDIIELTFSTDGDYHTVGEVKFPNPWETRVLSVLEEITEPEEGDDADPIEVRRIIDLARPVSANPGDRIQLTTKKTEEEKTTGSVLKKYNDSEDGDRYISEPLGVESIEFIGVTEF